ncbi:hypothetical protein ACN27F_30810 [Solwaraspora sp. WMMB335]|uniref:hypothetical protein n=1 Tax=Solwaraspora sp. WMMB335 TaxID=3404118 RepID=UPI003B9483DC
MHALEAAGGAAYHRLRGWVLGGAFAVPSALPLVGFTVQPAGHLPSLLLAVGLCVAGLAAYAMTPWRIQYLAGTVASNL